MEHIASTFEINYVLEAREILPGWTWVYYNFCQNNGGYCHFFLLLPHF